MDANSSKVPELDHVAKGTSFNFIGAVSRNLLGFAFVFLLARILKPEEVGLFFLGVNVVTVATILAIGGMDVGLRRFISISHGKGDSASAWDYLVTAAAIALTFCIVLGVGLYVLSEWMAESLFSNPDLTFVLRALVPYLFLYTFAEILLSATQGYRHMQYWVLCLDITNSVLRIAFVFVLSLLGFSLYGVIFGYLLAIFIAVLQAYYYFLKVMPPRSGKGIHLRIRELTAFSIPVALARLVNSGNGMLETLLLGYFMAESSVGIYTVALKISVVGAVILSSFNTMFAPIISRLHSQGRMEELNTLFSCVTRWAFSLSLPLFILVAWYASSVANLFGSEYMSGADTVAILCLGQVINALTGPSGNLLLMSGYRLINLWTNLGGLILSVLLNIAMIPYYGIIGCALAVATTIAIINVIRVYLAWKVLGMHPYDMSYWKPIVAGILSVAFLYFAGPSRETAVGPVGLLAMGAVTMLLYGFLLIAFGLTDADRYVFNRMRSRLGGKPS